jgi:hypothetical protein
LILVPTDQFVPLHKAVLTARHPAGTRAGVKTPRTPAKLQFDGVIGTTPRHSAPKSLRFPPSIGTTASPLLETLPINVYLTPEVYPGTMI